jgi:hypothetical protein
VPTSRNHHSPVRPRNRNAGTAVGRTEQGGFGREVITLKRVRTAPSPNSPAGAPQKGIGRVVFVPTRTPANDVGDQRVTLLALVDDLAMLAAELYVMGRLDADHERES